MGKLLGVVGYDPVSWLLLSPTASPGTGQPAWTDSGQTDRHPSGVRELPFLCPGPQGLVQPMWCGEGEAGARGGGSPVPPWG